jgi:hypothetical protein
MAQLSRLKSRLGASRDFFLASLLKVASAPAPINSGKASFEFAPQLSLASACLKFSRSVGVLVSALQQ